MIRRPLVTLLALVASLSLVSLFASTCLADDDIASLGDNSDVVEIETQVNDGVDSQVDTVDSPDQEDDLLAPQDTTTPRVTYQAHVQRLGWMSPVYGGSTAGTSGRSLRLEALKVSVEGIDARVEARSHVQSLGWDSSWIEGAAGSEGKALRLEAIQLRLAGPDSLRYDIEYRVHVQSIGWQSWRRNGAVAGTTGRSLRIEAIEIRLAEKPEIRLAYRAHVQKLGWQDEADADAIIGTTGKSLRLEAFEARVDGTSELTGGVAYSAHVQGFGWQNEVTDGAIAGTIGKSRRVEAVHMRLTGNLAGTNHLWYRAYIQKVGWTAWACDGQDCGSVGLGLRAEALQAKILPADAGSPANTEAGTTATCLYSTSISYKTAVQGIGWQATVADGAVAGTTGKSLAVEAISSSLVNSADGGVEYRVSMKNTGWGSWTADGSAAGEAGAGSIVEAISLRLTGTAAKLYDVWYRVHVQGIGWMGWTKNGAAAGTTKLGLRVEALQVRLVKRGEAAPGSTQRPYTEVLKRPHMILIGDSRTVSIHYTNCGGRWISEVNSTDGNGNIWSAKVGAGYSWMTTTGVPRVEGRINSKTAVVILMGVNDCLKGSDYWGSYISYLNGKAAQWTAKGASVYYAAVGPVGKQPGDNTYHTRWGDITNSGHVIPWNNTLKQGLSSNIIYLDAYSALAKSYHTLDGIHYDQATNRQFYNFLQQNVA